MRRLLNVRNDGSRSPDSDSASTRPSSPLLRRPQEGLPFRRSRRPNRRTTPRGASPSFARAGGRSGRRRDGRGRPFLLLARRRRDVPRGGSERKRRRRLRRAGARQGEVGAASHRRRGVVHGARLGAARRQVKGGGRGEGGGRRRAREAGGGGRMKGTEAETREGEGDVGNGHVRSWLSDSAEAAAAFSLARRPPRSPAPARAEAPGTPGTPGTPRAAARFAGDRPRGDGVVPGDARRGSPSRRVARQSGGGAADHARGGVARREGGERPSGLPRRGRRDPRRPRPIGPPLDRPSVSATPRGASCSPRRRRRRAPASADPPPARRRLSGATIRLTRRMPLFSPMRRGGDASERSELASAIASKPTAARGLILEDLEAVREGFPLGTTRRRRAGFFGPSRTNFCARRGRTRARAALRFVAAVAAAQPPGGGRRARIVAAAVGFPDVRRRASVGRRRVRVRVRRVAEPVARRFETAFRSRRQEHRRRLRHRERDGG